MKLLCDFFKKLKNPIEFHYYCSFCYEYIGAKRHPEHCTNKHCLQDFSKEGSLAHFIVVPFITQLQSLLASKYNSSLTFTINQVSGLFVCFYIAGWACHFYVILFLDTEIQPIRSNEMMSTCRVN